MRIRIHNIILELEKYLFLFIFIYIIVGVLFLLYLDIKDSVLFGIYYGGPLLVLIIFEWISMRKHKTIVPEHKDK